MLETMTATELRRHVTVKLELVKGLLEQGNIEYSLDEIRRLLITLDPCTSNQYYGDSVDCLCDLDCVGMAACGHQCCP